MSSIPDVLVSAAGSSGVVFAVSLTTTLVVKLGKAMSAEGKVAALRKLLDKTKKSHNELAVLLPEIPKEIVNSNPAFSNLDKKSRILGLIGSELTELEDKLISAGIWKWSPLYLTGDILFLSGELTEAHNNTARSTKAANEIIAREGIINQLRKQLDAVKVAEDTEKGVNGGGNLGQDANDGDTSGQDADDGHSSDQDTSDGSETDQEDRIVGIHMLFEPLPFTPATHYFFT